MRKCSLLWILFCTYSFVVSAQNKKNFSAAEFLTTSSGLKYKIIKDSVGGIHPETGGFITFWFEMRTQTDSIFDSQFSDGDPVGIPTPEVKHPQSIEEGLLLLTQGDSALFILDADSLYTHTFGREAPPYIHGDKRISMIIKMGKVYSKHFVDSVMAMQTKENQRREDAAQQVYLNDSIAIKKYLKEHKLNGEEIEGGVYIVKLKSGKKKSPYIVRVETVETKYIGKLLIEGTEFDRSAPGEYFKFTVGIGEVIRGWDYAFQRLKTGEKALILIPSASAYGATGAGNIIPPDAPLLFEVDIKK
jgi:FKBP-type peptidyl-prolyl cis-trans isomerase FkpA